MASLATPEMFLVYKETRKNKLVDNNKKIKILIEDRDAIYRLLTKYSKDLDKTEWRLDKLSSLLVNDITKAKLRSTHLSKFTIVTLNENLELLQEHIKYHVIKFLEIIKELAEVNDATNILVKSKLRYPVFSKILRTINFEASKEVLGKGQRYRLGNTVGSLYMVLFDTEKANKINHKVDWGESMKTLEAIAKGSSETNELLYLYKSKTIKKQEFIDRMRAFTYTIDTPDKPKWLVYITGELCPYWRWSKKESTVKNHHLYGYTPTNFVCNATKSQIDFTDNAKNIDEILNTTLLGCRDKAHALLRFDPSHEVYFKS